MDVEVSEGESFCCKGQQVNVVCSVHVSVRASASNDKSVGYCNCGIADWAICLGPY